MKKYLLRVVTGALLIGVLTSCFRSGEPDDMNFVVYLNQEKLFRIAQEYLEKKEYQRAVYSFKEVSYVGRRQGAAYMEAVAHARKGEMEQSKQALGQACKLGLELKDIDEGTFGPVLKEVEAVYPELRAAYIGGLDTTLALELDRMLRTSRHYRQLIESSDSTKTDSLIAINDKLNRQNIARLREITEEKGWPGVAVVGKNYRANVHPDELVRQGTEEDHLYFLDKARKAAVDNVAEWNDAMMILQSTLWKFAPDHDGFVRLWRVQTDKTGELEISASRFTLYTLSWFQRQNDRSLMLYATTPKDNPDTSDPIPVLTEIREFLISQGADAERIQISKDRVPLPEGEAPYEFGLLWQ